jgi:hydroxymethylpyrimidine/phosphomethylpyrimidine kinase
MSISKQRPYVLTIAGHDPSGGAGLNADIKTMEVFGVFGLSVCSAITCQTEDSFDEVFWVSKKKIKKQLEPLLNRYNINHVKVGIIEDLDLLLWLVKWLKNYNPDIFIIWDPVLKTSTGFPLHKKLPSGLLKKIWELIDMVTPNWEEIGQLSGKRDPMEGAKYLSKFTTVYLKGGHRVDERGVDYLWINKEVQAFTPDKVSALSKHGSGCVFSSALLSALSLQQSLPEACVSAKKYVEAFLHSSNGLLGTHYSGV